MADTRSQRRFDRFIQQFHRVNFTDTPSQVCHEQLDVLAKNLLVAHESSQITSDEFFLLTSVLAKHVAALQEQDADNDHLSLLDPIYNKLDEMVPEDSRFYRSSADEDAEPYQPQRFGYDWLEEQLEFAGDDDPDVFRNNLQEISNRIAKAYESGAIFNFEFLMLMSLMSGKVTDLESQASGSDRSQDVSIDKVTSIVEPLFKIFDEETASGEQFPNADFLTDSPEYLQASAYNWLRTSVYYTLYHADKNEQATMFDRWLLRAIVPYLESPEASQELIRHVNTLANKATGYRAQELLFANVEAADGTVIKPSLIERLPSYLAGSEDVDENRLSPLNVSVSRLLIKLYKEAKPIQAIRRQISSMRGGYPKLAELFWTAIREGESVKRSRELTQGMTTPSSPAGSSPNSPSKRFMPIGDLGAPAPQSAQVAQQHAGRRAPPASLALQLDQVSVQPPQEHEQPPFTPQAAAEELPAQFDEPEVEIQLPSRARPRADSAPAPHVDLIDQVASINSMVAGMVDNFWESYGRMKNKDKVDLLVADVLGESFLNRLIDGALAESNAEVMLAKLDDLSDMVQKLCRAKGVYANRLLGCFASEMQQRGRVKFFDDLLGITSRQYDIPAAYTANIFVQVTTSICILAKRDVSGISQLISQGQPCYLDRMFDQITYELVLALLPVLEHLNTSNPELVVALLSKCERSGHRTWFKVLEYVYEPDGKTMPEWLSTLHNQVKEQLVSGVTGEAVAADDDAYATPRAVSPGTLKEQSSPPEAESPERVRSHNVERSHQGGLVSKFRGLSAVMRGTLFDPDRNRGASQGENQKPQDTKPSGDSPPTSP